jgi:hypothetical protein
MRCASSEILTYSAVTVASAEMPELEARLRLFRRDRYGVVTVASAVIVRVEMVSFAHDHGCLFVFVCMSAQTVSFGISLVYLKRK